MNRGCKPGSKERGLGFCFFFGLCWVLVVNCRLSCPTACGICLWLPGIKPVSTTLEGRFLIAGPPGIVLGLVLILYFKISFKVRFPSVKHLLQMKTFFFFLNKELYCGGDRAEAHCFYAQSKSYKQKKC